MLDVADPVERSRGPAAMGETMPACRTCPMACLGPRPPLRPRPKPSTQGAKPAAGGPSEA